MALSASLSTAADVAAAMEVDPDQGLPAEEATRRLAEHGPNELVGSDRDPAWKRFLAQFHDPLIYLLLGAIVIATFAWILEGAHGVPVDAIVIAVIVVANAVLGFVQENKAADAVAALADMTAAHASVLRGGDIVDIPASELVPGDVLVLSEGDSVGADARLLTATSLRIQESSLTGESEAVTKDPAPLQQEAQIGDRTNMVFKGTAVASGVGRAVVTATGMGTEMGTIATLLDETEQEPSPLQREITRISTTLGLLVIGIAIVVMVTMAILQGVHSLQEAVQILLLGVSLAVAAVPEGLPAILSLVLAIGVRALAARNAVMKNLPSVETLGSTSVICSDKTGTLTRNEMTLREVITASGRTEFSGIGYAPDGEARTSVGASVGTNDASSPNAVLTEARRVIAGGALANNAHLRQEETGDWSIHGDPTEAAFLTAQHKLDGTSELVSARRRLGEVPFSSDRKMMSVLIDTDEADPAAAVIVAKGAPDVLLERCTDEQLGADTRPLTPTSREAWAQRVEELGAQGYRTLAVAWRRIDQQPAELTAADERDLVLAGVVGIIDPPREEAKQAIADAHRAGIRTVMITGDHPVTASRIAADLGITDEQTPRVATGQDIAALSDEDLVEVTRDTSVYARVAPEHKLRIVDALQGQNLVVAMTGDGVNDAPALKSADIGIAMGITGTEVTKEAATMILGDDDYTTIVHAVRQGRVVFDNIASFMRYLLSSNMGEVAAVFLGVVLAGVIGLADPANPGAAVVPLLATQILWINLVTDSGPALAMGLDPEIDDVMARRPRPLTRPIIDRAMWGRILSIGLIMGALTLLVYDLTLPGGLIGGLEHLVPPELQLDAARTTAFTALVMMQLFNALNSRSARASAFHHLATNRWLWVSLALAVVAQVAVVHLPVLQTAFGTVALQWQHWLLAVGAGASVLAIEEIIKAIQRARD